MKLLIVDSTAESQAQVAKRIESFSQSDREMLDLKVGLVSEQDFLSRVKDADIVIIGSGMQDDAVRLAKQAVSVVPYIHVLMYVTDEAYGGGAFRAAHAAGVRKVFTESSRSLDLLQELVSIYAEFRRAGRTREGRVVMLTHAKGGVGATSITAALGEVTSSFGRRTLLWDLDVESRDLCRALSVNGLEAKVVSAWVNGTRDISKESFMDAIIPLTDEVSVLMPPERLAEQMDLVCHTDGMQIAQRILDLARVLFDVIIIDSAGRLGPCTGALMRHADDVLIVLDDTLLGLTAVDLYLSSVKNLIGSSEKITFVVNPYSGSTLGISQIAAELEPAHQLGEHPWRLPPIPNDMKAQKWPGTGMTLYSLGQKNTAFTFEKIAEELGLVSSDGEPIQNESVVDSNDTSGWLGRLLGKKGGKDEGEFFS